MAGRISLLGSYDQGPGVRCKHLMASLGRGPHVPRFLDQSGYIPTTDQSYTGSVGIFPRRTNQMQEAWDILAIVWVGLMHLRAIALKA
eukprot:371013-Prorocentrum_minimum.AAC.1